MTLPQIRQPPWFPGQFGVRFSDVQRGLRWESVPIVIYVDHESAAANDANDGTNPEGPKLTIQSAITQLTTFQTALATDLSGSVIVVSGDAYTENVTIPVTAVPNCTLLGGGPNWYKPEWTATTLTSPCLSIECEGWVVDGFHFNCPSGSSGIQVRDTGGASTAYKTVIQNCIFDGLWGGLYGIDFVGAPHRVTVQNCWFIEMHREGTDDSFCIIVSDSASGPGNPYQCAILNNRFTDSDNYIGSLGSIRAWNVSWFQGNTFEEGLIAIPALYLDLRGGTRGYNIVTGNYFGGTYTNLGGYHANAATPDSCWMGNMTEATPGTVGDNGYTVRTPA